MQKKIICDKCVWRIYRDKGKVLCPFSKCVYGSIYIVSKELEKENQTELLKEAQEAPVKEIKNNSKRHKPKRYKSPL